MNEDKNYRVNQKGKLVEVWRVEYSNRRFQQLILVEGTEEEVRDYMESEMGHMGRYSACTRDELRAAKVLHIPIYIAPEL